MMFSDRYPRDKETLLREIDVYLRLADIQRSTRMKDRLSPKWWETGVVMLLFASALGLLASLFQYAEVNDRPLNAWMLFWFCLMILTAVFTFEFLLIKIFNLRRSNDLLLRMYDDLRKQQENLAERLEKIDPDFEKREATIE